MKIVRGGSYKRCGFTFNEDHVNSLSKLTNK